MLGAQTTWERTTMAQADTVRQRARDADELIDDMEPPSMFRKMLPNMMKMVPPLMLMGLMVLLVGLGLGIWGADLVGDGIGTAPGEGSFEDLKDAQVLSAWLQPFLFLGMGLILFSISVTLLSIATGLRKTASNIAGLIVEHESVER